MRTIKAIYREPMIIVVWFGAGLVWLACRLFGEQRIINWLTADMHDVPDEEEYY